MENAGKTGELRGMQINRRQLKLAVSSSAPMLFALGFAPYSTLRPYDIR